MTDILDEITKIPFDIFWDKYMEVKPGIYSRNKAEKQWFYMQEQDRVIAFECLSKKHPAIFDFCEPYEYLEYWDMPF
jgi:hypothetical protein